jgi:5-methylcytosine-specific restriction endonuclease McrA
MGKPHDARKYREKRQDPRWQKTRLDVFCRDDWRCVDCGAQHRTLHVHHTYYVPFHDPWDYPLDCFKTLCEPCHDAHHGQGERLTESLARMLATFQRAREFPPRVEWHEATPDEVAEANVRRQVLFAEMEAYV